MMWCPQCQGQQFTLELINLKEGVAVDNVICKCGNKFLTVWRVAARQEHVETNKGAE